MKMKPYISVLAWVAAVVYLCTQNLDAVRGDYFGTTGLVIHAQQSISAPIAGTVHSINPAVLDSVAAEDTVAVLIDPVYYQIRDQVGEKGSGDSQPADVEDDMKNLMGFVTPVATPMAGSVTELLVRPGEGVLQGQSLMTVTSQDTDYVVIYVDPRELTAIGIDSKVQVLTGMEPVEGVVSQIGVSLVEIPKELSQSMFNSALGVPVKIRLVGESDFRHAQQVEVRISTSRSVPNAD